MSVVVLFAVADPIRFRIMEELADGVRCVCDLQREIGCASNLLSYHLRVLREAGLVEASRRGRWIDYRVSPSACATLRGALPRVCGLGTDQ